MFDSSINQGPTLRSMAALFFPILDRIWVGSRFPLCMLSICRFDLLLQPSEAVEIVRKSHKVIYGLGDQLVQKEKREAMEEWDDEKSRKSILSLLSQ